MAGREIVRHLRIEVMLCFVVAWNVLLIIAMWAGGSGFSLATVPARLVLFVACASSAGFALAVAYSPRIQAITLRARDNIPGLRRDLWFFAILMGAMCLMTVFARWR
jgi:uncharacterized membrane protein